MQEENPTNLGPDPSPVVEAPGPGADAEAAGPPPGVTEPIDERSDGSASRSDTSPPPSVQAKPPSMVLLATIAGISLAADLGTKIWAKEVLSGPNRRSRLLNRMHIIPDHLDFIFAQNPGGAWSFMRSVPEGLRRPFFLIVSASAIVFIISIYRRVRPEQWGMRWGLPFALGGAFGNLVDRMRYGWVVDFVDIYVKRGADEHHWPTFNVADIAIVIGVALMGYEMMRPRRDPPPVVEPAAPVPSELP
jgi:signal peptidase II